MTLQPFATTDEMKRNLWLAELAGWLHNMVKLHPDFLLKQKGRGAFRQSIGWAATIRKDNKEFADSAAAYAAYWPQREMLAASISFGGPFDSATVPTTLAGVS